MLILSGSEPCCLSYRDQTLEVQSTEALCAGKLYSVKAATKKGEKFAVIKINLIVLLTYRMENISLLKFRRAEGHQHVSRDLNSHFSAILSQNVLPHLHFVLIIDISCNIL